MNMSETLRNKDLQELGGEHCHENHISEIPLGILPGQITLSWQNVVHGTGLEVQ
jgi:hypothetical protein